MTTDNRFLDVDRHASVTLPGLHRRPVPPAWVRPRTATSRELVVLLENGGFDLGLPAFIDSAVAAIPGASAVVDDAMRGALVARLRDWLRSTTDGLLESAELAINRYSSSQPTTYGAVKVLRNGTATYEELRDVLFTATRTGHVVDLLVLTHGSGGYLAADGGIDGARIRNLATEFGGPLNLRSVYMMSCIGSRLNRAWLDVGARVSAGTVGNNNLPEPTTHFFWTAWTAGQTFESAVTSGYRRTIDALNGVLNSAISALLPGGSLRAPAIDVSSLDVIASSRPEIAGVGSLTVTTDALPPAGVALSGGNSLVTTVLPRPVLDRLRDRAMELTLSTGRALSEPGRIFVESWERPLATPGPAGEAEMARRIAGAERYVAERVAQALSQQQVDALVSFACGIGREAFARSIALRLIDDGHLVQVPVEIRKWTRVRRGEQVVESEALQQRRRAEAELFAGPAPRLSVPESREVRVYSRQQGPVLVGIGLAEAVEWGLAAGGLLQAGIEASRGNLSASYDKAHRLMTSDARLRMPGAQAATSSYRRRFLTFPQFRPGVAYAVFDLIWTGNAYGEISTVVLEKVLAESSDWTHSEARLTLSSLSTIPRGTDPRVWPLTYRYEGTYDPLGNGKCDFQGTVEVDAFGSIRWVSPHQVVSRSLADWPLGDPATFVLRGPDVVIPAPNVPAEQAAYLREHAPT